MSLAVALVVLGYRQTEDRWCSACWARMGVRSFGLVGLPEWRTSTWTREEPGPEIARFLPPGHAHDAETPASRNTTEGVLPVLVSLVGTGCRFGPWPSEFARTLAQDQAFADFLAERITDGRLDVTIVRRLIAVPSVFPPHEPDRSDDADTVALMRSGTALYAEYRGVDPTAVDLWNGFGLPVPVPHHLPAGGR